MGSISEPERKNTKPPGIRLVESTKKSNITFKSHQAVVLIVTFLAYASYHASRKTTSIIKSALDPQTPDETLESASFLLQSNVLSWVLGSGWSPFNGSNGTALLGDLDLAFLFVYAVGMFFSGHIGDRMNLRIFLTIGMVGTGIFTSLFGVGYWANIHVFYYYLIVQMIAGLFQSTGWPSVVAVLEILLMQRASTYCAIPVLYYIEVMEYINGRKCHSHDGHWNIPNNCNQSCPGSEFTQVPYPFGFSSGWEIQLNCTSNGTVSIGEFPVWQFSSDALLVNLTTKCGRNADALSLFYSGNYAPISKNAIVNAKDQNSIETLAHRFAIAF
ncbi:putative glycerol-3-phosphate transporter 1 [Tanacetum coccineum]